MSEYQYYEFQAIERPLSERQMLELRAYSTRAHITSTSFVNDYSFGSFKVAALRATPMPGWRSISIHSSTLPIWGTRILKLRLPSRLLTLIEENGMTEGKNYCSRFTNEHGEEWQFEYSYGTGEGILKGSDVDWQTYRVVDGHALGLILSQEELLWLRKVWADATAGQSACCGIRRNSHKG